MTMGNSSRPGSLVVGERDHESFEVAAQFYVIRELRWNGIDGRSYELVRLDGDVVLTEGEAFSEYPTDAEIAEVLERHGVDVELGECKFCGEAVLLATAHPHHNGWVGLCCWDDRLRSTE
jgi:hypothetical protein